MVHQTIPTIKTQPSILDAEWITPEAFYSQNTARNDDGPSYGNGRKGASEYKTRSCKWHSKSYSQIAARYSQQAQAVEDGRDENGDLMFAV